MIKKTSAPIGVFDSGLGGLTVVRELVRQLPHEDIIYVGDTARVPYGTKSPDTIRRYAMQIAFYLLQKEVKMIVVACNTASAVALKALSRLPIPVIGVIEPGARGAVLKSQGLKIGVIGTPATVASHAYKTHIRRYSPRARVLEAACPLFVPLVEEGWLRHPVAKQVARSYLQPLLSSNIDTLVLGCTHYPLLRDTLQAVAGRKVLLIDSADETAKATRDLLTRRRLLNDSKKRGRITTFVTDNPRSFSKFGKKLLPHPASKVHRLPLENL